MYFQFKYLKPNWAKMTEILLYSRTYWRIPRCTVELNFLRFLLFTIKIKFDTRARNSICWVLFVPLKCETIQWMNNNCWYIRIHWYLFFWLAIWRTTIRCDVLFRDRRTFDKSDLTFLKLLKVDFYGTPKEAAVG